MHHEINIHDLAPDELVKFATVKGLTESEMVKHYGEMLGNCQRVMVDERERFREQLEEYKSKDIDNLEHMNAHYRMSIASVRKAVTLLLSSIGVGLYCKSCDDFKLIDVVIAKLDKKEENEKDN